MTERKTDGVEGCAQTDGGYFKGPNGVGPKRAVLAEFNNDPVLSSIWYQVVHNKTQTSLQIRRRVEESDVACIIGYEL